MGKAKRNKQQRPRCWFCGQQGVTDEHVLGRQFKDVLQGEGRWVHTTVDPDRPNDPPHVRVASEPRFISRIPCKTCNGGWMGDLDDAAVSLVRSMVRGRAVSLDLDARETLAAWAAKVFVCMSSKEPEHRRFVAPTVYREMGVTHRPPAGMAMWLGAIDTLDPLHFQPNSVRLNAGATNGYGGTLTVGRLLFHVIGLNDDPAPRFDLPGDLGVALELITPDPGRAMMWPAAKMFGPNDYLDLTRAVASVAHAA